MDFIKKHYEKIILSVVLLGLVGALVFLPVLISNDYQQLEQMKWTLIHPNPAPLPPLDLSRQQAMLNRLKSPYRLDFSTTNKLFNPMQWVRTPDGRVIKIMNGNEIGGGAVIVTKITPLYFKLWLDSVDTNLGARYKVEVERQASPYPGLRPPQPRYVSMDDPKKDVFTLLDVKGPTNNPTQLVVRLADSGDTVAFSKDKPYSRVQAYAADLKYPPGGDQWHSQRVGAVLKFAGDLYIIIAIDQNEVVLLQESNQKKWTLRYAP